MEHTTTIIQTAGDGYAKGQIAFDNGHSTPGTNHPLPWIKAWGEGWAQASVIWHAGFDAGETRGVYTGLHLKTEADRKRYQNGYAAGCQYAQDKAEFEARLRAKCLGV